MTSKKFFMTTVFFYFLMFFTIVVSNYISDDFGLFRSHNSRRIWTREKTSKYLMSFKYIPENFNAVLVGSSVSANLDTRMISSYEMYNLSMNSGNITELIYPLENLIESGKIKAVVFCLYDYTTKDSGVKGNQLDKKEYFGSLFSDIPFDIIKNKIKYRLVRTDSDVFRESRNGFYDFNLTKKNLNFEKVNAIYMKSPRTVIVIDDRAYDEFENILISLRSKEIDIYAFYYPIYKEWFQALQDSGSWYEFKNRMTTLFDHDNDVVWDMNSEEYDYITKSKKSYSDGHLSDSGSQMVIQVINNFMAKSE